MTYDEELTEAMARLLAHSDRQFAVAEWKLSLMADPEKARAAAGQISRVVDSVASLMRDIVQTVAEATQNAYTALQSMNAAANKSFQLSRHQHIYSSMVIPPFSGIINLGSIT